LITRSSISIGIVVVVVSGGVIGVVDIISIFVEFVLNLILARQRRCGEDIAFNIANVLVGTFA